jgi:hypothetical protein
MTTPLDKMTAHFRNKISGELKSIKVPEWDLEIFFKTANTLEEEGRMIKLAQDGKTIEALVETLIVKARDKDGKKLFKMADRPTFMNEVDPQVLIRVVGDMNSYADEDTVEELEKN